MKDMKDTHDDRRINNRMRSDTDRRSPEDRRSYQSMPKTPIEDSDGNKVTVERRRIPDRRLNSIEVEWVDDDQENCA